MPIVFHYENLFTLFRLIAGNETLLFKRKERRKEGRKEARKEGREEKNSLTAGK